MDFFILTLLVKAVCTAAVVVGASVAAEKFGPFWGGLIACFPISAGPAYVLLGLQHDDAFIAASALSSFASGVVIWAFAILFVRLGQRYNVWVSLTGTLAVWLVLALIVRAVPWTLPTAVLANVVAFMATLKFTPTVTLDTVRRNPAAKAHWSELPLRAVLVGLFVAVVVTASDAIGPAATGIAAVFPIAMSSLAVIMARSLGMTAARAAIAATVKPMLGIVLGMMVLSQTAVQIGKWPALLLAFAISMTLPLLIARYWRRA
ncbi:MAG: hypothetical protein JNK21_11405 [Rhodospirillaceae bacterium]|nr:hypothetical protein [Rhodospirillaceae bacterium]